MRWVGAASSPHVLQAAKMLVDALPAALKTPGRQRPVKDLGDRSRLHVETPG
jgi:hypothetical protein